MKFYTKIWNIDNESGRAIYNVYCMYYVALDHFNLFKISAMMPFDPAFKHVLGLGQYNNELLSLY